MIGAKALSLATLVLAMLVTAAAAARAQEATPLRAGVVMDGARRELAPLWRDGGDERAWCVTASWAAPFWSGRPAGKAVADTIYRVFAVKPAKVRGATATTVDADCPKGQPVMHTHPVAYGAADCNPSPSDYAVLDERGDPFAILWCDRRVFRFYYKKGVRG